MHNILLVFPSYPIPKLFPKRVQFPLGIAYLAAVLLKNGFLVKVVDSVVAGWEKTREVDSRHIEYGLAPGDIMEIIHQEKPDVIGISCMFGVQLKNSLELAKMIKMYYPNIIVVFGGAHASVAAQEILNESAAVDYVVIGEGEETFLNLLKSLNHKFNAEITAIDGLAYRNQSGKVVFQNKTNYIDDLDSLPYPAREIFQLEKYFLINRPHGTVSRHARSMPIVTSRGCVGDCIFCSIHSVWGYKYRVRSAENVVDEIENLTKQYGIKEFQIEDDNMTFDAARAEKICDLIITRDLKVNFTTPNGIAWWTMNKQLLQKMKQAGFYRLTFAIESGSEYTLNKIIKKPFNFERIKDVIDEANKLGFIIDTFYVIGFPGESPKELKKTFRFSRALKVNSVKYFIATPYVGTRLYNLAKDNKMLVYDFDNDEASVSAVGAAINTEYFSAQQINRIWLRETIKTQLILFSRDPLNYLKDIFKIVGN